MQALLCHAQKQLTHLFLVAYPVGRLQAALKEGEAELVYWGSIEIVLHKAVKKKGKSELKLPKT